MHRNRYEKHRWHHERHRTDRRRRFVSLAAIHRAVVHPGHLAGHFGGHIVAAIFVGSRRGRRRCRRAALVMMTGNVAEAIRAARHSRRRKRCRRQWSIQNRNRQQASQRAKHSPSIVVSAIQGHSRVGQSEDSTSMIVHPPLRLSLKMSPVCNLSIPTANSLS